MDSGNVSWILISSALVMFMTPGLALFYGGLDSRKNMSNMMMMNLWALLTVPLLWAAIGYTLAQSPFDADFLGGFSNAFLSGLSITGEDGGGTLATFVFLAMFAVITPALISGAAAPTDVPALDLIGAPAVDLATLKNIKATQDLLIEVGLL